MVRTQKGFTLIELVMVIVILGILAAVAVPKYIDMKTDAQLAACKGVYGGATSAASINFSGNVLGKGFPKITNATTLVAAMGGTPDGWVVSGMTLTSVISNCSISVLGSGETTTAPAVIGKSW